MNNTKPLKPKNKIFTRVLDTALLVSLIPTFLVPLTGVALHKIGSTIFLLLCVVHTVVNRKRLDNKKVILLGLVIICFASGIFAAIFDQIPFISSFHNAISIISVFFLAIHIFVFHRVLTRR